MPISLWWTEISPSVSRCSSMNATSPASFARARSSARRHLPRPDAKRAEPDRVAGGYHERRLHARATHAGIEQDRLEIDDHAFLEHAVVRQREHAWRVGILEADAVAHEHHVRVVRGLEQIPARVSAPLHRLEACACDVRAANARAQLRLAGLVHLR